MGLVLAGTRVAVVGGDKRILHFIPHLLRSGAVVYGVGLKRLPLEIIHCSLLRALNECHVIILPMGGCSDQGLVPSEYDDNPVDLNVTAPSGKGLLILSGVVPPRLQEICDANHWTLVPIAEDDELAILNSVPTAEGAVRLAQERSLRTIHGSTALVLGLGRCGSTLAQLLHQMGARVHVACRSGKDLARAVTAGYSPLQFAELEQFAPKVDYIFNTVPAHVLSERVLARTKCDVVIIDIASSPGGLDLEVAQRLRRVAVLAPGIPGRYAPQTAGNCLGKVLPRLIVQNMKRRDKNAR